MGARRKGFTIAALVSIADIWITAYRGPAIWQVWSRTPFYRMDILLLSGTGSLTRADIWAKTLVLVTLIATTVPTLRIVAIDPAKILRDE